MYRGYGQSAHRRCGKAPQEDNLEDWLASEQRGFLPNRSMLANIVDLEAQATHRSLEEEDPAIVLFDFAAAFPCISQEFIISMLDQLGLPQEAIRLVRSLYHHHEGRVTLEGSGGKTISLSAVPVVTSVVCHGAGRLPQAGCSGVWRQLRAHVCR